MQRDGKKQIVLSGYYGCGNAGDEAVLAGIKSAFEVVAGDRVALTVLSNNPEQTTTMHGLKGVLRMDLRSLLSAVRSADLLVSGGGSLLQDTTSLKSLLYYLFVMRAARFYRKPYMFYAQGLGPLNKPISRRLTAAAATRASAITLRDSDSAQLLKSCGVNRADIKITADPAFALNPASEERVDQLLNQVGLASQIPFTCVALRKWPGSRGIEEFKGLISHIREQTAGPVLLMPMHFPDDCEFSQQLVSSCKDVHLVDVPLNPTDALGIVARASAVVAMRLHALIFAARCATPAIALSYDPKVDSLMRRIAQEQNVFDCRTFDPGTVANSVFNATHSADQRTHLQQMRTEMEDLALENSRIALTLL